MKKQKLAFLSIGGVALVVLALSLMNITTDPSGFGKYIPGTSTASAAKPLTTNLGLAVQQKDVNQFESSKAKMLQLTSLLAGGNVSKNGFIQSLQKMGLQPQIFEEKDGLVPDMVTVRTTNTIPGVRYITAHFMGKNSELQYFSYELPKGPGALLNAIDTAKKYMILTEEQKNNTDESLISYAYGKYNVFCTELSAEDIADHHMNAYDEADEGTIKCGLYFRRHDSIGDDHADHDHDH